jgi:hypothetical protein
MLRGGRGEPLPEEEEEEAEEEAEEEEEELWKEAEQEEEASSAAQAAREATLWAAQAGRGCRERERRALRKEREESISRAMCGPLTSPHPQVYSNEKNAEFPSREAQPETEAH